MNAQKSPGGIEWTRVWGRPGYTANPVRGCLHGCRWRMPDGKIAVCYAETIAGRLAKDAYPNGFDSLSFHADELASIRRLKRPAGIFIDSMSDLFGSKVPDEWIERTFEVMQDCQQHIFFSLTKNPGRLREWDSFPQNLWLGVSVPPTFMFDHELSIIQQHIWLVKALQFLADAPAAIRWVSIEPLTFDCSDILAIFREKLDWAVIGAASNGPKIHQPAQAVLARVLDALRPKPVFFKGNLRDSVGINSAVGSHWRQEFPPEQITPRLPETPLPPQMRAKAPG